MIFHFNRTASYTRHRKLRNGYADKKTGGGTTIACFHLCDQRILFLCYNFKFDSTLDILVALH